MRRKKSNLDEMQEQELLKVEHNGCWIAFWGLQAAIIIQSILFGSQDCKTLAGEGIVFIVLSIYIAVACVRRGIWDRRFQMNAKTNLIPEYYTDERSYVRGFPGTETRHERDQLVWECDERCDFSEMAVPLMLVSLYSVGGMQEHANFIFSGYDILPSSIV